MGIQTYNIEKNREQLEKILALHEIEQTGISSEKSLMYSKAIFEDGEYVAGLVGKRWLNTFHISLLAVKKVKRNQGLAKRLVEAIEEEAKSNKCLHLTVNTQDYQAKTFYEALGFIVIGQLADSPFIGTTRFFLAKKLS